MVARIPIDKSVIAQFCKRHHIRRLALFGSVLRNDFDQDSDIDVLVEFDARFTPGLALFDVEKELARLVGRRVDLVTESTLSRWIRDEVMATKETIYAAPGPDVPGSHARRRDDGPPPDHRLIDGSRPARAAPSPRP